MDSKTLAVILVVFVCVLLFPLLIGIIGGIFGVIGATIGGVFGFVGWLFGAIIGAIGAVFGALFGAFGWVFDHHDHWHWPGNFFNHHLFTLIALLLIIVAISRSRKQRTGK